MSPLVLQGIASGVVTGCVYALIAISLVIVYKSSDVINFAGGEMVMLGGYLGMFALIGLDLPYLLIFPFAAVAISVTGEGRSASTSSTARPAARIASSRVPLPEASTAMRTTGT